MNRETDPPKSCGDLGLNIQTVTLVEGGGWKDTIVINPNPPDHRRYRKKLVFVVKAKIKELKVDDQPSSPEYFI